MPFWFCCGKRNPKKRLSYKQKDSPEESEDEPPNRETTRRTSQEDHDRAVRAEARAQRLEESVSEILRKQREEGHASNFFRTRSAEREAGQNISVDESYGLAANATGFERPTSAFARMTSETPATLPMPLDSYASLCTFPLRPSNRGNTYYVVKKRGVPACIVCGWDRCMKIKGGVSSFASDNMAGGVCRGFVTLDDAFNYLEYHFQMKMAAVVW